MDWKSIAGTLWDFGFTALGTAIGGPAGGVFGSAVAAQVAAALGVSATPEAVGQALSSNPDLAKTQLATLERKQQAELTELQARLVDVQDARHTMVQLAQADAPMAWGPVVISAIVLLMSGSVFGAVMLGKLPDNSLITGAAISWVASVIGYWIGSSSGSKRNGDTVRSVAEQTGAALAKVVRR